MLRIASEGNDGSIGQRANRSLALKLFCRLIIRPRSDLKQQNGVVHQFFLRALRRNVENANRTLHSDRLMLSSKLCYVNWQSRFVELDLVSPKHWQQLGLA